MPVIQDPWASWRNESGAKIGIGRAGGSLPTREWLDFNLAHARARDAVHLPMDTDLLQKQLTESGETSIVVSSAAKDRSEMLRRPDLGRHLSPEHSSQVRKLVRESDQIPQPYDLVVIIGDGLSAPAVQRHSIPLLVNLLPRLRKAGWQISPIVIALQARVALQDEIGSFMGANLALSLLGERPGLSSPDSLSAYFVYGPGPGRTDADRNCVSNIRPEGLSLQVAADTLYYLLTESRQRRLSGVSLKDDRNLTLTSESPSVPSL